MSPPVASNHKPVQNTSAPESPVLIEHWRLLSSQLFWAYDRPLKRKQLRWEYNPHPPVAWFLRKGRLVLEEAGSRTEYQTGQWVFPGLLPEFQEFSKDAHLLSIRFLLEWPNGQHLFDRTETISFAAHETPALNKASENLARFASNHFPNTSSKQSYIHATLPQYLELQPLFTEWIFIYYEAMQSRAPLSASLSHIQQKTQQALHYLDTRPLTNPLHEAELAGAIGMSTSHLHKVFLKEVGVTPVTYWNNRKLALAKSELTGGPKSIKAISYDLGFSSPENFAHWFRTQTNQSPRQYRTLFADSV